jgi:HAD superfamily hydrolase (TIGR01549 family)
MTSPGISLITVDVGGTLGTAAGPGLAMRLAAVSPLSAPQARTIMRGRLHTQPAITAEVIDTISADLQIPPDPAHFTAPAAPFSLFPGTLQALEELAGIATVATLSNVTCVDADTARLAALLAPHVAGNFPSCETGYAKPDPRAFLKVASHYGVTPGQVVHIGDDWACDAEGAAGAGMRAIWLSGARPVPDQTTMIRHGIVAVRDITAAARHLTSIIDTEKDTAR